ncbi:M23 family metallopeptidase [Cohnella zeiphila]|uniref:M23 family metallopeptidase n=1 Tax=Cohnella zeiphila TaxID=2761120 RepID=A0A7X0SG25_9BACL|nr:M23 family metallopeptidase [Cohnella zeiphila]MBB6729320.1 M23 family metallopeptidase [Cohnella zeiphila]
MEVRKQVRRRRRERVEELVGKLPFSDRGPAEDSPRNGDPRYGSYGELPEEPAPWEEEPEYPEGEQRDSLTEMNRLWNEEDERQLPPANPPKPSTRHVKPSHAASERLPNEPQELDPEKWWKERQRTQFAAPAGRNAADGSRRPPAKAQAAQGAASPGGPGLRTGPIGSLADLSSYRGLSGTAGWDDEPPERPPFLSRLIRGLAVRFVLALLVFAAVWGWMHSDLPGNGEVQALAIRSVTEEMNFDAVEAWYEKTFGGSPAFLPMFRHQQPSQAAIAEWSRDQTVPPLEGRIIRTFAQDGAGIRMAAPSGSPVKAVHSGRVTKVTTDGEGVAAVWVQHPNEIVTEYEGLENPEVKPSDWVEAGQTLGGLASSSREDGGDAELFFAVIRGGKTIDPADVVPIA